MKLSRSLIFLGAVLLFVNCYLYFLGPGTNLAEVLLNYVKPDLSTNTGLLVFAGVGSWVIPIFLVMLGIAISKRSMKKDKALEKLKPRA